MHQYGGLPFDLDPCLFLGPSCGPAQWHRMDWWWAYRSHTVCPHVTHPEIRLLVPRPTRATVLPGWLQVKLSSEKRGPVYGAWSQGEFFDQNHMWAV